MADGPSNMGEGARARERESVHANDTRTYTETIVSASESGGEEDEG